MQHVLPPTREISSDAPVQFIWTITPRQARILKISGVVGSVFLWFLSQFLQARGLVNLHLSRVFLVCAALCLWVLLCLFIRSRTGRIVVLIVVALAAVIVDRITPKPAVSTLAKQEPSKDADPAPASPKGGQLDLGNSTAAQPGQQQSSSDSAPDTQKRQALAAKRRKAKLRMLTGTEHETAEEALFACQKQHPSDVDRLRFHPHLIGCINAELLKMPHGFEVWYVVPSGIPASNSAAIEVNGGSPTIDSHDNETIAEKDMILNGSNAKVHSYRNKLNVAPAEPEWISIFMLRVIEK